MADRDKEEQERRSGAVLPFGTSAAGGTPGWGGWLQTAARLMAVSPEAALLRILGGAVLGVAGLGLGATLYGRAQAATGGPLAVRFDTRRPGAPLGAADARPPMENFVRGMAGLWGPVLGLSDSPADLGSASTSAPTPDAPKAADAKGSPDSKGKEAGVDTESSAREVEVAAGASGAGRPGAGALASADLSAGGPGAASAARVGAALDPAASQDGAASAKRDMRAGAVRSARPAAGKAGKGALNQLKFAQNRSALGAASASPEKSFSTAQSAFEGGTPGAGSAIGGAGASQGGAGVGGGFPQPKWVDKGPVGDPSKRLSCPSGYTLDGSDCKPLEGVNKTPYQSLVDMAKAFLIVGAALALLGLLLVTRPVPWMQALGGILLGVAAGLIIAAVAIGADIQSRYGQKSQKDAIDSSAGRAGKGQSP